MKRLVWLLLAVLGTALVQVPPVAWAAAQPHRQCCCCDGDGSCGMPGCLPPVSSAPARPTLDQTARVAGMEICRVAQPVQRVGRIFLAAFVEPAVIASPARSSSRMTPPASVPLFKAHCSFLI